MLATGTAPGPVPALFERPDDLVAGRPVVGGGVPVGAGIAAFRPAAHEALAKVLPDAAVLHARLADLEAGRDVDDLDDMGAGVLHAQNLPPSRRARGADAEAAAAAASSSVGPAATLHRPEPGPANARWRALLAEGGPILADGAMGTMLFAAGLQFGDPPEVWNLSQPEVVRRIQRGYLEAGSRIVMTNTFGGNRRRLQLHGLADAVDER